MPKLLYTWYFEKFTASVTSSGHSALRHEVSRMCTILHLAKFMLHSIMLTEKYLVYLSGVVPVRCMQTTLSVTLKHIWIYAEAGTEHQFYNQYSISIMDC